MPKGSWTGSDTADAYKIIRKNKKQSHPEGCGCFYLWKEK